MKARLAVVCTLALASAAPFGWCEPPADGSAEMDWEAAADGGEGASPATEPVYLSVLDLIGKLTIAVLIAYGLSLALRWAQHHYLRSRQTGGHGSMQLEEVLPLGPDAKLYIVSVEGRRVLLASCNDSVQHLSDLGTDLPVGASRFTSVSRGPEAASDELNVVHAPLSTTRLRQGYGGQAGGQGAVRPDVVSDPEAWAQRRDKLLSELEES